MHRDLTPKLPGPKDRRFQALACLARYGWSIDEDSRSWLSSQVVFPAVDFGLRAPSAGYAADADTPRLESTAVAPPPGVACLNGCRFLLSWVDSVFSVLNNCENCSSPRRSVRPNAARSVFNAGKKSNWLDFRLVSLTYPRFLRS